MSFLNKLVDKIEALGKANKPVYAVAVIAVFKGIFRPIFTMMDKESDPETKKYAAVREGATELTALVTYPTLSYLTEKLAPAFSPHGKNAGELLKNAKSTLGFFAVCFAAVYAIPKLCNIIMPYVMTSLKMDKQEKPQPQNEIKMPDAPVVPVIPVIPAHQMPTPFARVPLNMKGGMRV